ncbi:TPA: SpoIIE family protein phosphatase [Candidatus Micrarchaeota archaeon]|nr:SpoIIE family protein phosphatase [Candidatus Micrarchaeota archaeon]
MHDYASAARVGGRSNQEDFVVTHPHSTFPGTIVLGVFDGMGGHGKGEVASNAAGSAVSNHFKLSYGRPGLTGLGFVATAMDAASDNVKRIKVAKGTKTPGTTATFGLIEGNKLSVGHIGDGTLWLFRTGVLQKLTIPHHDRFQTNVLTKALPYQPGLFADFFERKLKENDVLLFHTDGLERLSDNELMEALGKISRKELAVGTAARLLAKKADAIGKAKYGGKHDNLSLVLYCHSAKPKA